MVIPSKYKKLERKLRNQYRVFELDVHGVPFYKLQKRYRWIYWKDVTDLDANIYTDSYEDLMYKLDEIIMKQLIENDNGISWESKYEREV
jgi:hypothetical protein